MGSKLIPYITALQIDQINAKLAAQIQKDYEKIVSITDPLLVIVTLKGASFFAADLLRKLDLPLEIDFIRVASYGYEKSSSGSVRFVKDIETPLHNRHVIVLDEIIDSGHTLKFLLERMAANQPKSLKLGALLDKPSRREVEVRVDYIGHKVEDKFLVGYGLDYAEKYRNLKDICVLEG